MITIISIKYFCVREPGFYLRGAKGSKGEQRAKRSKRGAKVIVIGAHSSAYWYQ
jgi:hypothetical protein